MRRFALSLLVAAGALVGVPSAASSMESQRRETVAFVRFEAPFGGIHLVDVGGGQRQLTGGIYNDTAPVWSPSGDRIAFMRAPSGFDRDTWTDVALYVMNADGSHLRQLVRPNRIVEPENRRWPPPPELVGAPAWSPDGRSIVLARWLLDRRLSVIDIVKSDGSGQRRLVSVTGSSRLSSPAWSPDGHWIVYAQTVAGRGKGAGGIYSIRPDGSSRRRVTTGNCPAALSWAPDGQRIAFIDANHVPEEHVTDELACYETPIVFVIKPDGRRRRMLAIAASGAPAWSPDGTGLAYVGGIGRSSDLYLLDANGSQKRRLAPAGFGGSPTWSPDGRWIAFEYRSHISVIGRDGRGERPLTAGGTSEDESPAWRPQP